MSISTQITNLVPKFGPNTWGNFDFYGTVKNHDINYFFLSEKLQVRAWQSSFNLLLHCKAILADPARAPLLPVNLS